MVNLSKKEAKALKEWIEQEHSHDMYELDKFLEEMETYYNQTKDLRNALKKLGLPV